MNDENTDNKLKEDVVAYNVNTLSALQHETSDLALKTSSKQILLNCIGELKADEMPCIFTDEEYKEEIQLSEKSGQVSNDDVIKELSTWGFAI